jgi:hypothetical protein
VLGGKAKRHGQGAAKGQVASQHPIFKHLEAEESARSYKASEGLRQVVVARSSHCGMTLLKFKRSHSLISPTTTTTTLCGVPKQHLLHFVPPFAV